jgi:hypothetical protein
VLVGHLAIEGSIPIGDELDDTTNVLYDMTVGEVSYDNTINLWYVMHNIK